MRRICSIFNVWSGLLGDTESSTYANYQEGRAALYHEAILPMMDLLRDEFNYWLAPAFGDNVELEYDRDSIEAIQEDRAKKYAYLSTADWLKVDEKREATGYEPLEGGIGDVVLVPMGKMPLEELMMEPEEEEDPDAVPPAAATPPVEDPDAQEPPPDEAEEGEDGKASAKRMAHKGAGGFWMAPERKAALGRNVYDRMKAREKRLDTIVRQFLTGQAKRVNAAIRQYSSLGAIRGRNVLSVEGEAKLFLKATQGWMVEHFRHAGESGIRASKGQLTALDEKIESPFFQLYPNDVQTLHKMIVHSGTDIAQTTMVKVMDLVGQGELEAWTVEELTQNIWSKLGQFMPWRSRLIARTETAKVENFGLLEGYKQTEFVEFKGWNCAYLEDSRQDHIDADVKYSVEPIPLNEPFQVGDQDMMYPGDPAGGAGNVCNCYCSTFPEIRDPGDVQ
jgi:hypothetical protein